MGDCSVSLFVSFPLYGKYICAGNFSDAVPLKPHRVAKRKGRELIAGPLDVGLFLDLAHGGGGEKAGEDGKDAGTHL